MSCEPAHASKHSCRMPEIHCRISEDTFSRQTEASEPRISVRGTESKSFDRPER